MLENAFRSKGLELLVELAEHTAQIVRQIIDVDHAIASQIGNAAANQMMRVWGGQNVYFLMGLMWKINQRDRKIFADCNLHNHRAMARKYEVSLQWIYSVIKRVKKEELARIQGNLFEGHVFNILILAVQRWEYMTGNIIGQQIAQKIVCALSG